MILVSVAPASAERSGSFPPGFLWGAATSAHQVEGGNTNNDWYEWEQAGHTKEPSGLAADHYHRFKEDLSIAADLGLNAYRMSLEWSRLEPVQGRYSDEEFAHYRNVLQTSRDLGMKTFVTLHHFTNPIWMATLGGWSNPSSPQWFEAYTQEVVSRLGDLVDFWITINEPNVNALTSYGVGATPPGISDLKQVPRVIANFLKAHARAYHAIHAELPYAQVGFAHHMRQFRPARRWHPGDMIAAMYIDRFWNTQILNSIRTGHIRLAVPFLASHEETYTPLKGSLDFLGVNYYTRDLVRFDFSSKEHFRLLADRKSPKTDLGWDIYPRGLYSVLKKLRRYDLPVYITENGIADAEDKVRSEFICSHLAEVSRAITKGVNIKGYLYWSLIDNFEWLEGFSPRFGLVEVNYATQQRLVRDSGRVYSDIARNGHLDRCH